MPENKTKPTSADVLDFINNATAGNEQKRADSLAIIELMRDVSGYEPVMWGPSIIGFGAYHYQYASGHSGDAPIIGFSPRKAAISIYAYVDTEAQNRLIARLGKFKMGKACIYVKKLSDIDTTVLRELCKENIGFVADNYKVLTISG